MRFRRRYGASPWHLLAMVAMLAVAGYAASLLLDEPAPVLVRLVLWFVGAAVVWDLVLGPLLGLADLGLRAALHRGRVPLLNYVRVPALLSGLLLLVSAPLVLQRSEGVYAAKTGLTQDPYLGRWLAVTAALFVLSAVAWGVAARAARRARD